MWFSLFAQDGAYFFYLIYFWIVIFATTTPAPATTTPATLTTQSPTTTTIACNANGNFCQTSQKIDSSLTYCNAADNGLGRVGDAKIVGGVSISWHKTFYSYPVGRDSSIHLSLINFLENVLQPVNFKI